MRFLLQPQHYTFSAMFTLLILLTMSTSSLSTEIEIKNETPAKAGHLTLTSTSGLPIKSVHIDTEVTVDITGLVATTNYVQRFKNASEHWAEGVYVFPLPTRAAIHRMELIIGERVIVGEVKERAVAEHIYQKAKLSGQQAALTTQQRDNLFTQNVANIAPNQLVEVRLTFVDTALYQDGVFEWRLPTTLTPRFISGTPLDNPKEGPLQEGNTTQEGGAQQDKSTLQEAIITNNFGWAKATNEVPDAPYITPPMITPTHETRSFDASPFAVDTPSLGEELRDLPESLPKNLPKNIPENSTENSAHTVLRTSLRTSLHNPMRINIKLQSGMSLASIESKNHSINVSEADEYYRIAFSDEWVEMDRDVVLQWKPMPSEQPRAAIFQQQMENETYAMFMMLPPDNAIKHRMTKDIIFVIDVSGSMQGQSIVQAKTSLAMAIDQLAPEDSFNIIAFNNDYTPFSYGLTQASREQKSQAQQWVASLDADGGTQMYPALRAAYSQMRQPERLQQIVFITDGAIGNEEMLFDLINTPGHHARLFTVGIGSAPNSFFMTKAAQLGRGSYELISTTSEVHSKMSRLFHKLNHVAATNIEIAWPDRTEAYPVKVPDLFYSEALLSYAKLPAPLTSLNVTGNIDQHTWQTNVQATSNVSNNRLGTLWARKKVADIEDKGRRGELNKASVKAAVLDVALTHQLLTRYTAFIASEEMPSRPQNQSVRSEAINNIIPHGTPMTFARTSTMAPITFWLGVVGMIVTTLLFLGNKGRVQD